MLRCCPKILNAIDAPWKMYPVGFLFGLGFDTATEVALLAMAATAPSEGVPFFGSNDTPFIIYSWDGNIRYC